jgi:PAS domain S-box-containing protein
MDPGEEPGPERLSLDDIEAVQSAVLASALDPIIVMDGRGRVRDFNPAAERVFGRARAAVVGRCMADLIIPERFREAHRAGLERFLASGASLLIGRRIALAALRADGSEFPIELVIAVVPGRASPLFAGYVRDLTEQRRAEWRQRFLLEVGREVAATLDYEDTLRRVSRLAVPTLCDGIGVYVSEDGRTARRVAVANADPEKEAVARKLHERHLLTSDAPYGVARVLRTGRAEMLSDMTDEIAASFAVDDGQVRVLRALGVRSSMIVPLKVRDRVVGALSMVMDASGRAFGPLDLDVAEEFALRTAAAVDNSLLYREARAAVARAAEESRLREELIAALERRNADLDAFSYAASHDLKAPLRGIASIADWVEEDLGDAATAEVRGHLGMLRGRVRRLETLIDGILRYSRAGRTEIEVVEVDVGEMLAETVELLAPPPTAAVTVAPGMPLLRTAAAPLQQVFMNLVGNALKHAAGPATEVRVGVRDVGPFWEFSVADNGPGIAPAFHGRVWEIFQSLKSRDAVEGSGIGLAVVRKTVGAMGGRAWLESEEGAGACFRFTWPKRLATEPPG